MKTPVRIAAILSLALVGAGRAAAQVRAEPVEDRLTQTFAALMTPEMAAEIDRCAAPGFHGWTLHGIPGGRYFECRRTADAKTGVPVACFPEDRLYKALAERGISIYDDRRLFETGTKTFIEDAVVQRAADRAYHIAKARRVMDGTRP